MDTDVSVQFKKMFEEFHAADHSTKKNKVVGLLEYLEDKLDFAKWMLMFIKGAPDVSDEFLERNYQIIIESALQSAEDANKSFQLQLEKMADIKSTETQSQTQESDEADDLLHAI